MTVFAPPAVTELSPRSVLTVFSFTTTMAVAPMALPALEAAMVPAMA